MDSALKQRLIGAAVLIALAIIFVPMFLSGPAPKQDNATVNLDIPPPPEREFQTRVVPADGGKATQAEPARAATTPAAAAVAPDKVVTVEAGRNPRVEVPADEPVRTSPAAKPVGSGAPAQAPAAVAAKPAEGKPTASATPDAKGPDGKAEGARPDAAGSADARPAGEGRFLVHLGVYGNAANAANLLAAARKLNLPSQSESVEAEGKPATRVRLGPFASRAAAEAARLKFRDAEPKVPASVVEATPDTPKADAPASALPANRAGGWAVQLAAFKTAEEANRLRDRARAAGFAAFVEPVGQGDARLWRVRVGPEADRAGAEKTRDAVKSKLALSGTVVTQP